MKNLLRQIVGGNKMKPAQEIRENEAGFSLLELLLVVGVGSLLILAGISTYNVVTRNNNVNEATRLVATIRAGVQRAYQAQNSYGTDEISLQELGVVPTNVQFNGDTPPHAIHGFSGVDGDVVVHGNDTAFSIVYNGVPAEICTQLGTAFSAEDSDVLAFDASGGGTVDATSALAEDTASTQVANVTAACGNAGNVDLQWTFF